MQLEEKIRSDKPLWAERLKDAHVTASSRDRLKALSPALNNRPDIGAVELKQYLDNFGWEALSGITDLLGDFNHRLHREALCDYLTTRGRDHPDIVAKGIYDKRWYVVRNFVSILARIGDDRSLQHLRQAVKHEERRVRLEVVTALKDCDNDKALEILAEAVMDSDREIQQETINAILARRGRPAFETIAAVINDERFGSLEPGGQKALLRAFSILGGDVAVGYLCQLIKQYNPLRDSTPAFYRQAAFDALSHNRSEKAEKLLVKLASSWRPDIRRRAAAALRRRREIVFGRD
jgi:HEAT repeat protein